MDRPRDNSCPSTWQPAEQVADLAGRGAGADRLHSIVHAEEARVVRAKGDPLAVRRKRQPSQEMRRLLRAARNGPFAQFLSTWPLQQRQLVERSYGDIARIG